MFIEDEKGGFSESNLLCIHGLSKKQIEDQLRNMGLKCGFWKGDV